MMMLFVIVPVVGLAIDAGTLYAIKARLQSAVDASALAAARSFSEQLTLSSQQTAAANAAVRWFHSDIPNSWMAIGTVADPTVTFPTAAPQTIVVTISATVAAPTYFMRIFNINSVPMNAVAQASRRFLNLMLVVDRSGSLYQSGSCSALQQATTTFVNLFVNGQDTLGLLTFGTDYNVDFPMSTNFNPTLPNMLGTLNCYGYTNAAATYWAAYQQLVNLNSQGALNVIVFFTDGIPNTLTFGGSSTLPVKTQVTSGDPTDTFQASDIYNALGMGGLGLTNFTRGNASQCRDSSGRVYGQSGWSPGPFSGVLSSIGGLYLNLTPNQGSSSIPISQSTDAQRVGTAQGDNGGCAFDYYFNNSIIAIPGGSPSRNIAGPGFTTLFDIAYLPSADINGNLTDTGYGGTSPYVNVSHYGSGPYAGQISVVNWPCTGSCSIAVNDQIALVGENALDNAAQRARTDSVSRNLNVYTYTIGLGNAIGGIDDVLLERIANDRSAPNYNSALPVGQYVYAPTASTLNQAFTQIASQVLRLSM
jgi:hypothetical protein